MHHNTCAHFDEEKKSEFFVRSSRYLQLPAASFELFHMIANSDKKECCFPFYSNCGELQFDRADVGIVAEKLDKRCRLASISGNTLIIATR